MKTPSALTLKPLTTGQLLALFFVPALALIGSVYFILPALTRAGLSEYTSYCVALMIPLALMLMASLIAYRLEGNPFEWNAFKTRFRLKAMRRADWLWAGGSLLIMWIAFGLFSLPAQMLVKSGLIPLPASLPGMLDPNMPLIPENLATLMGGQVQGNWGAVGLMAVLLFFNIVGEEFWWRGFILPRQELSQGKYAWLFHGILWTLFHAFKYWDWLALLPVCLTISFVAQRRQSTSPGLVTHAIFNGLSLLGIIALILMK